MFSKNDVEDMQLVKRVQNGENVAFDILVEKYQYRVFKIVHRFVHNNALVKDVSQDVFIKAYKALAAFRGDSAFYTWLYRIAVNTSKSYAVQENKAQVLQPLDAVELNQQQVVRSALDEEHTPEWLLSHMEMHNALFNAAQHLPKALRIALLLREVEGFSYDEIAEIMHCPLGTVRSRIYRARESILKEVKDKYDSPQSDQAA